MAVMESDSCVGRQSKREEFLRLETTPAYRPNSCWDLTNSWKPRGKSLLSRLQTPLQDVLTGGGKKHTCQDDLPSFQPLKPSSPQATCLTILSDIKW